LGESDSQVSLEVTTGEHIRVVTFAGPPEAAEDFRDALVRDVRRVQVDVLDLHPVRTR